jgi:hypothetical protein
VHNAPTLPSPYGAGSSRDDESARPVAPAAVIGSPSVSHLFISRCISSDARNDTGKPGTFVIVADPGQLKCTRSPFFLG